jgi:hypothetical protein
MDKTITVAIVTGLFGILSGVLLTYLGAVLKFRKDLEAEYDKDLRSTRIKVYQGLWNSLQLLARYDRPEPLNPKTLGKLSLEMREWYFQTGGLYLSEETRNSYFDLKETIRKVLDSPKYRPDDVLDPEDSQNVLHKGSLLRARLTQDVGTRRSSVIADS